MFSTPGCGWVNITIGDWTDRASYLTDPHIEILKSLINKYKNYTPATIKCDAEGWEYLIVIDDYDVFIIDDKNDDIDYTYRHFDINSKKLSQEVIEDIERDIDAWANWSYNEETPEELEKNKKELLKLIKELRDLIE